MQDLSKDSQPLLNEEAIVPGGITVKDDVYNELFKDTNDEELDSLTEHCLQILCCSGAILLRHQLEDQLPGGKFYSLSHEIMNETKTTPKHNIICERDFAQLHRKLQERPQISNVALSGIVCFINNKTPQYLESLPEEERHKLIERAISQKKVHIKKYKEMKEKIKQQRIELMEKRRQKIAKQTESKEKRKEELDKKLEEYGGLWRTPYEMETSLYGIPDTKKKDAVITQIKYRKFVLGTRPTERTLLQLQSGKEKFTLEQLRENLESVLKGISQQPPVTNANKVNIKQRQEREEELSAVIEKKHQQQKRKQENDHSGFKLVGKTILHKWIDDGKEKWYTGKIVRAIGDVRDEECEFEVKYNDGDEQFVQLYKENKEDIIYLDA